MAGINKNQFVCLAKLNNEKKPTHTHTKNWQHRKQLLPSHSWPLLCVYLSQVSICENANTQTEKKKTRTNVFYKEDARDWINDAHDWELATALSSQSTDFCRPAWFWSSHYHISLLCSGSVRRVLNSVGPVHLLSGVMCILNQLRFKWCEKQALPSARCKIAPLFAS